MLNDSHYGVPRVRGITRETCEGVGVHSILDRHEAARLTGLAHTIVPPTGIAIPYSADPRGYCRYRPDVPREGAGKYESPRNQKSRIYAPQWYAPFARLYEDTKEVWITEGEWKALAILQSGRAGIALPGIWQGTVAVKDEVSGARRHELHAQLAPFVSGRRAIVLFDADFVRVKDAHIPQAMARLVQALERAGAEPYVSFLTGEHGKGLDDHLVGGGTWQEIDDRIRPIDPDRQIEWLAAYQPIHERCEEATRSALLVRWLLEPDAFELWMGRVMRDADVRPSLVVDGCDGLPYQLARDETDVLSWVLSDGTRLPAGRPKLVRTSDIAVAHYVVHGLGAPAIVHGDLVHVYDPARGIWERQGQDRKWLYQRIQVLDGAKVGESRHLELSDGKAEAIVNAIHKVLGLASAWWQDRPRGCTFADGWVGESLVRVPHDPVQRSTVRIDAPWPGVEQPEMLALDWQRYTNELFRDDDREEQRKRVAALEEFGGAALCGRAWEFDRALVLLGEKNSGKSTVAQAIVDLFPASERTAVDPRDFTDRFAELPLATASLNYVGDLGSTLIRETREVKKVITGRDLVHCDRKHKDAIDFYARCAHLWLGNEMPPALDSSGAFERRLLFLRADREGGDGSVDRTVPSRLADERAEIAARCLIAFSRLVKRGGYDLPRCHEEESDAWRRASNTVQDFVASETVPCKPAEGATTAEIYRAFGVWSATQNRSDRVQTETQLALKLRALGIKKIRVQEGGRRDYRWGLQVRLAVEQIAL